MHQWSTPKCLCYICSCWFTIINSKKIFCLLTGMHNVQLPLAVIICINHPNSYQTETSKSQTWNNELYCMPLHANVVTHYCRIVAKLNSDRVVAALHSITMEHWESWEALPLQTLQKGCAWQGFGRLWRETASMQPQHIILDLDNLRPLIILDLDHASSTIFVKMFTLSSWL